MIPLRYGNYPKDHNVLTLVPDNYQPPAKNTPIALRLVPQITGYTIQNLLSVLTEPIPHVDCDIIYLKAYQWPWKQGSHDSKPAATLKGLLAPAMAAKSPREAIAVIPSNLFVWSKDLEECVFNSFSDATGERTPFSERPDWNPNLSGLEGLIEECPSQLTTICTFPNKPKHKPREEGVKETKARDALIQKTGDEIRKEDPGLNKESVVRKLKMKAFPDLSLARIRKIYCHKGKSLNF